MKPLVWFRYIDDIFFIWRDGPDELAIYPINPIPHRASTTKRKTGPPFDLKFIDRLNQFFLDVEVRIDGRQSQHLCTLKHGLLYLQDGRLSHVAYSWGERRQIKEMQLNSFIFR